MIARAMRYGVLGTGAVGATLGSRLVQLGHEVRMGGRGAGGDAAVAWVAAAGARASEGSFADAAAFGEVVINATAGMHSLAALRAAGADNLRNKVLIDVSNPLLFGAAGPTLGICNDDSLGEQIQRAFPDARVVKALNTVNCEVMADPAMVPGAHAIFVCGEDADAKAVVGELLHSFGWPRESVLDLGGIDAARATEMYVMLWVRLMRSTGTARFNISLHAEDATSPLR